MSNGNKAESTQDILARLDAIVTDDHFVYRASEHGSAYVNKRALVPHVSDVMMLCERMADGLFGLELGIDAVVAPAIGALAIGFEVAAQLDSDGTGVLYFQAEKLGPGREDGFAIRTKPELLEGRRVVVVEDILTTGSSAIEVIKLVRSIGAEVVAVAAICNRGGVTAEKLGVEALVSLMDVDMEKYPGDDCPLCAAAIPINTELGYGAAFLAAQDQG